MKFPCKECLVKVVCIQLCNKLSTNNEYIINIIKENKCPDCSSKLIEKTYPTLLSDYYCSYCESIFYSEISLKDNPLKIVIRQRNKISQKMENRE